jgi:hypothetical protein
MEVGNPAKEDEVPNRGTEGGGVLGSSLPHRLFCSSSRACLALPSGPATSSILPSSRMRQILRRLRNRSGNFKVVSQGSWILVWESWRERSSQFQFPVCCFLRIISVSISHSHGNISLLTRASHHQCGVCV